MFTVYLAENNILSDNIFLVFLVQDLHFHVKGYLFPTKEIFPEGYYVWNIFPFASEYHIHLRLRHYRLPAAIQVLVCTLKIFMVSLHQVH